MPRTPDRFPGEREEDTGIILEEQTQEPQVVGEMRNVNGTILMKDDTGVFDPRLGGGGFDFQRVLLTTDGGLIYSNAGAFVVKVTA